MSIRPVMSIAVRRLSVLAVLVLMSGCDSFPADPRNSLTAALDRGSLRVGILANPPWVELSNPDAPAGMEVDLVAAYAEQLGIDIDWHTAGVEQQIEALTHYQLDLVIGGFSAAHPWRAETGQTFTYFHEPGMSGARGKHVILTAPGENALLMSLERFLFSRQDPERYLPALRASQP